MLNQLEKIEIINYIKIYNNQHHVKEKNKTINIELLKKFLDILDSEALYQIRESLSVSYDRRNEG